jgi:hypothetical protein
MAVNVDGLMVCRYSKIVDPQPLLVGRAATFIFKSSLFVQMPGGIRQTKRKPKCEQE